MAIATAPSADEGQVNGLVPDVTLGTTTGAVSIRDYRPALVALVPLHCNCTELLSKLAAAALGVGVKLVVVAPTSPDAEVAALPGRLHSGEVEPAWDLHGELAQTYAASGVTVLIVRPNATVSYIERNVQSAYLVSGALGQMLMLPTSVSKAG